VRASRDPTTKTVLFEDSAAVVGVVVAFAGVALHEVTGNQVYDGVASVIIAVVLATVAVALGRDTRALLIGEAASPEERQAISTIIEAHPAVDGLFELLTMALAPDRLLVAARIDLADGLSADEIERASSDLDRELRERIPSVWQVFLDATPRSEVARAQADRPQATGA
jgi:divalent metal cation (Fe/Co/Zn/Cd) transporter